MNPDHHNSGNHEAIDADLTHQAERINKFECPPPPTLGQ